MLVICYTNSNTYSLPAPPLRRVRVTLPFYPPFRSKHHSFAKTWPLGYDNGDESPGESFCLDHASSSIDSTRSLNELARELEKLGVEIVESLACAVGFDKQLHEIKEPRFCSLMWILEGVTDIKPNFSGRFYPKVIALQYQIRCRKYSMLADFGWVFVSPQVDSVLVTLGNIAQVMEQWEVEEGERKTAGSFRQNQEFTVCNNVTIDDSPRRNWHVDLSLTSGDYRYNDENEDNISTVDDKVQKRNLQDIFFRGPCIERLSSLRIHSIDTASDN